MLQSQKVTQYGFARVAVAIRHQKLEMLNFVPPPK